MDVGGYFARLGPGQPAGKNEGNAGDQEIYLGKELFQAKIIGHAGQVSIDKIRVLLPANEFDIPERNIGPEINGPGTVALQQVIDIQQSQFMPLAFRQEQQDGFAGTLMVHGRFDTDHELLPDDIANQVFLGRMDMAGHPKETDPMHEREDDPADGLIDAFIQDERIQQLFEGLDIEIDHAGDQFIDQSFFLGYLVGQGNDFVLQFLLAHFINMGYFIPIFGQQGNIQHRLYLLVTIIPDISAGTAGFQEIIPLLPDPYGMGLDPRKIFQVLYGKHTHAG